MKPKVTKPKIVSIAGGTGRYSVLSGLKNKADITALFNITDSGGSSGILRVEHGILPPGDGIQAFAALAKNNKDEQFLKSRFFQGSVNGHRIGNFMYLSAADVFGGELEGIYYLQKLFKPKGTILPVSVDPGVDLIVKLEDGSEIRGEHEIDVRGEGSPIIEARLSKEAQILPQAREAILGADAVLFGPGDLWTSIIPHLLVGGLKETILASKAKKIMICNLVTKPGETDNYKASDFARVLSFFLGLPLDKLIVNNKEMDKKVAGIYEKDNQYMISADQNESLKYCKEFCLYSLAAQIHSDSRYILRHDPKKTAEAVLEVLSK